MMRPPWRAPVSVLRWAAWAVTTAIETADIALMDDDLRKIPLFVRLSQATWNKMLQNITAALGIKLLFLVATLFGYGTLWMAVLPMSAPVCWWSRQCHAVC